MPKSIVVTRTPIRVSLAGGGTDLKAFYKSEPGVVVSTAIDKYVYVIAKRRFDDQIHVVYSKKEIVCDIDDIQHDLVREAMRLTASRGGIDVITTSDIPSEGSGLGSSSAVTVGVLNALQALDGYWKSCETLAEQACEVEINRLGRPIGKQDQYAAAFGGLRKYTFQPDESVDIEEMSLMGGDSLDKNLLLFYTNKTRQAGDILERQQKDTEDNRLILQELKYRADWTWDAIADSNSDLVGNILHDSWMRKQLLAPGITTPSIDAMYEHAREAGATGGKICGAGGGGFLLLYVDAERQQDVRDAMADYREVPFTIGAPGSTVILAT